MFRVLPLTLLKVRFDVGGKYFFIYNYQTWFGQDTVFPRKIAGNDCPCCSFFLPKWGDYSRDRALLRGVQRILTFLPAYHVLNILLIYPSFRHIQCIKVNNRFSTYHASSKLENQTF